MRSSEFDWGAGVVEYWDLDLIDSQQSMMAQPFGEDLAEIVFPGDVRIGIGWYEGLGAFLVQLVRGGDWDDPIMSIKCVTMLDVREQLPSVILAAGSHR